MKATTAILVFCMGTLIFFLPYAGAQEGADADIEVPAGMEVQKVGATNLLVPKGATVRQEGASIFVEGTTTFMSRKLRDIEMRFNKLEVEHRALAEEVERLQKALETLHERISPPQPTTMEEQSR
jgi:hypothetical protein